MEKAAPIPCAKRFGGPEDQWGFPSRGATTLVAKSPKGLSFGPPNTLETKPQLITPSTHVQPVAKYCTAMQDTPVAMTREALSLTGCGKEKKEDMARCFEK
eukprot:RCo019776